MPARAILIFGLPLDTCLNFRTASKPPPTAFLPLPSGQKPSHTPTRDQIDMEPRGRRRKQQGEEAVGDKENGASAAPPPKRPRTQRKPLAELPTTANNASAAPAPAPIQGSKRTTRAAARQAAAAAVEEDARKREAAAIAARSPVVSKQPDAGAAQASVAPYIGDIDQYLRSLEVRVSRFHFSFWHACGNPSHFRGGDFFSGVFGLAGEI